VNVGKSIGEITKLKNKENIEKNDFVDTFKTALTFTATRVKSIPSPVLYMEVMKITPTYPICKRKVIPDLSFFY
jgi:hypothetical protein